MQRLAFDEQGVLFSVNAIRLYSKLTGIARGGFKLFLFAAKNLS